MRKRGIRLYRQGTLGMQSSPTLRPQIIFLEPKGDNFKRLTLMTASPVCSSFVLREQAMRSSKL